MPHLRKQRLKALKPRHGLFWQSHFGCLPLGPLLIDRVGVGLLGPLLPLMGDNLAPCLHEPCHAILAYHPVQHPRSVATGEKPTARLPHSMNSTGNVDDEDESAEGSHTQGDVLVKLQDYSRHFDARLVRAVGEIVVPSAGNVMGADRLHFHKATIEVGRRPVELLAVRLGVLVVRLRITGDDLVLVQERELVHELPALLVAWVRGGVEEQCVLLEWQGDRF